MDVNKDTQTSSNLNFNRVYLEQFITDATDRNQVKETIAEANAAESLRCYFNENKALFNAFNKREGERLKGDFVSGISGGRRDGRFEGVRYCEYFTELSRRFCVLESFVLRPVELESREEITRAHLSVRYRSIELLEDVLSIIIIGNRAFPLFYNDAVIQCV